MSTVAALRALFPAGSMTGAPSFGRWDRRGGRVAARAGVRGAFGWIAADGRADLAVPTRLLMTAGGGTWTLGTGGGITVESEVAEERAESEWKAERLLRVFD